MRFIGHLLYRFAPVFQFAVVGRLEHPLQAGEALSGVASGVGGGHG
jgi:hypothetical protein